MKMDRNLTPSPLRKKEEELRVLRRPIFVPGEGCPEGYLRTDEIGAT